MVEVPVVILRVQVIGCKNLVAKDSGGTSDPYVVAQLPLWREKFNTPVVNKTLNPTFDAADATFDFPIFLPLVHVGAALKLKVWDKDYIMSDYLGEAVIDIDNWFEDGVVRGFQDSNNTPRTVNLFSSHADTVTTGSITFKLGFIRYKFANHTLDFGAIYKELRRRAPASDIQAPKN